MNSMSLKKLFKNSMFFIALIGITFFIVFKDNSLNNIIETLKSVNLTYIYVGILFMLFFIFCEAINIRRMLRLLSYDISIFKGLKYAFIGFFFSSITPSASGGQPMQIYYMKKDNVDLSHSSLVLLVELASFQFVTIVIALLSFVGNYKFIVTLNPAIKFLISVGIIFNTIMFLFIVLAIFSKKFISKTIELIFKLVSRVKFIDLDKLRKTVDSEISQYQEGAIFIKNNKMVIVKVILTTFAQICFNYSITFFVYKSFNLSTYSFLTIFSLQSILFISVSAIPLPGAVGSSESSFLTLFKTLFPASILSSAMLLSRGISFYLFVIISGIIVLFIVLFKKNLEEKYMNNRGQTDKVVIDK